MSTSGIGGFLGIASGTDWNSIISKLVEIERRPLDKVYEQRDQVSYNQSVMKLLNEQLASLDTKLSALRFESTYFARKTTSSSEGHLTATAEAKAAVGTYNVQINQLARASRASSGLDGMLYNKVANLSDTNTMGINALVPTGDFQKTRALAQTQIKNTTQAGISGAQITAGDTFTISGTLKDGTAVSGTFTFAGDSTDTLQRLGTTIAQVFHGEIASSVGSNGELVFIETDPAVAGDVTFDVNLTGAGLVFHDNDYSGSTFSLKLGNNVAGAGATSRRLVHEEVFTSGGTPQLNSTTLLSALDQATNLNAGDIIRINGTESGGAAITQTDFTIAAGSTIDDVLAAINGAFTTGTASYQNGRIVLTNTSTGASQLSLSLSFVDQGAASSFTLDNFAVAEPGRANVAQMVTTGSFTVEGTGEHLLSSSNGKAGRLRGTVTLVDPSNTLKSYGVTEFDMFSIDPDGAAGPIGPVSITGISEYSTLQDCIDAINTQVPGVTAQLVESSGSYRFEIVSNKGGQNVAAYDAAGGIIDRIMSIGATTLDSAANDGTNTFSATTNADDFTIVDWFQPDNGGPLQRRVATGDEGGAVEGLIGGVAIMGAGMAINPGVAVVKTVDSAELNTTQDMYTYLFGASNIAVSPATTSPALDPSKTLATAGFAVTPQNANTSPLNHTDGFFTINGVRINVGDVSTMTANDLLGRINAANAGVTAYFDSATSRFYLRSNTVGSNTITLGGNGDTSNFLAISGLATNHGGVQIAGQAREGVESDMPLAQGGFTQAINSGVFTINNTKISIDAGVDSLDDVIKKINNSGAGVLASYDPIADLITLSQDLDKNPTALRITVGDASDTSNFLEAMNLTLDTTVQSQIGTVRQNSQITINGVDYERNSNTVDDVIDKVTLNLNAVTTGPETITVSADTGRLEDSILDFIVEFNTTMELMDSTYLTKTEREKTAVLTEEKANSMTTSEIEDYISTRDKLLVREFMSKDSGVKSIKHSLITMVQGLVNNSGPYKALSHIGLTTSEVGAGVESVSASLGRLLSPTSDRDTLKSMMESNTNLMDAIQNHHDDLYDLFAGMMTSQVTYNGSRNLTSGMTVASGSQLHFTIGNGTTSTEVTFNAGSYTQTQIINNINQQISTAGLSSTMFAFYDSMNQLSLRSGTEGTQSLLQILDLSTGTASLIDALGWQSGNYAGSDPRESGGVARRTRDYIDNITSVGGIVMERIRSGGSYDRQIEQYTDTIDRMEDYIADYEQRQRDKYARLETSIANLQAQQSSLESAISKMNSSSGSSS
jgi:flagellar capping protein FliD